MREGNFGDFVRSIEDGIHDFTQRGKCSRCGECCTSLLPVTKAELKDIARHVKKRRIRPTVHHGVAFDFSCPFRDDDNKECMIYGHRPFICRDFICNKAQREINARKSALEYNRHYKVVNLRNFF